MGLPVQSEMDMERPEEHVLWALVKMNEKVSAPMLMPRIALEEQSKHLFECGFRHHPDLQQKWYVPASPSASSWEAMSGEWVDHPPEDQAGVARDAVARMSPAMREALKAELSREEGDS